MPYECHPLRLDPGIPCRDEGLNVFSVYKICVDQYFYYLPTTIHIEPLYLNPSKSVLVFSRN